MKSSIIFSTRLSKYKPVVWQGQAMYLNYSKLKNHLDEHLGNNLSLFFSEPHISNLDLNGTSKATWSSELISNNAVPYNSLNQIQKDNIDIILSKKLGLIQGYIRKKLASSDSEENNWGHLIESALEIPDKSHIMVEGNDVVLVAWGFQYHLDDNANYSLRHNFPILTTPDADENIDKQSAVNNTSLNPETETSAHETTINTDSNSFSDIDNIDKGEINKTDTENLPFHSDSKSAENINTESAGIKHESLNKNSNENKVNKKINDSNVAGTIGGSPPISAIQKSANESWWKRNKWLWIILLLLIILLICCLKFCHLHPANVRLPQPGTVLPPIDSTKIITDPGNKIGKIISNKINVGLTGENKNLQEFANKFKELYPGNDYQIVFLDTTIPILQLQVPETERENIIENLPDKMKGFELTIFPDNIYENNYIPNDPEFTDRDESWYSKEVKAPEAWDMTMGNSDVVVAIIDDGFDPAHREFKGKIYKPWNVVTSSDKVNTGRNSFHGTHVAGIALALADNNFGIAGIAPRCKFMPVQVGDYYGRMSSTAIISGILYAINHGANVINMSLGLSIAKNAGSLSLAEQRNIINNSFLKEQKIWTQLFKIAYNKNIVVVLAGGNDNILIGIDPMQRTKYTINVSATDPNEYKASFSNFGSYSTISAPGVHIYSSIPDGKFEYLDGTSMAAPVVTGGIALIKSINPAISFDQIVDLLKSTGIPSNTYNIGNILQLDRAVGIAKQSRQKMPKADCSLAQNKIDSLLQEIEKLRRGCKDSLTNISRDTMKLPPKNKDFNFAIGKWKSTTYIYQVNTGEQVTLLFDFYANGKGKLTLLKNDGTTCNSSLSLSLIPDMFTINQDGSAVCDDNPPTIFNPYYFVCKPGQDNCVQCSARNKVHTNMNLKFNLIKVQ